MTRLASAVLAIASALALLACSNGGRSTVTVYAASSLTDTFTEASAAFEQSQADYRVALNFASSSQLAAQINEGAPADVFASANAAQMQVVVAAGQATGPVPFAANELALAVPASSVVGAFDDLAGRDVILAVAAEDVPAGALFRASLQALVHSRARDQAFADAVLANVATHEPNVRAVLARLELGEADAGFVYSTDLAIAGDSIRRVEIPEPGRLANEYLIAAIGGEANAGANAFIAFILSPAGQQILASHGFTEAP